MPEHQLGETGNSVLDQDFAWLTSALSDNETLARAVAAVESIEDVRELEKQGILESRRFALICTLSKDEWTDSIKATVRRDAWPIVDEVVALVRRVIPSLTDNPGAMKAFNHLISENAQRSSDSSRVAEYPRANHVKWATSWVGPPGVLRPSVRASVFARESKNPIVTLESDLPNLGYLASTFAELLSKVLTETSTMSEYGVHITHEDISQIQDWVAELEEHLRNIKSVGTSLGFLTPHAGPSSTESLSESPAE